MEGHSPVRRIPDLARSRPPDAAGVLARERLFRLIDRRRRSAAIWVGAGAGYGKTTLVASYLGARRLDSRWYRLDGRDSDVATFFSHLSRRAGDARSNALPEFTAAHRQEVPAFARRYFRALFDTLRHSFVLVLDDYQEISPGSALHEVVADAIAEIPRKGCLIVISRGDPPPSMVRLRANRDIAMVASDHLRFTRRESDAIVRQWDEACRESTCRRFYEKTRGWPAGLILMLDQSMSEGHVGELPSLAPRALVFDYLAGEVLSGLEPPVREWLLKTAVFREMSPSMASLLTSEPRAGEILHRLHRDHHLMDLRLRGDEPCYGLHPLLVDALRARADVELADDERRELRQRARALLESAAAYDDLVTLLHSDRDWTSLTRLVLGQAADMRRRGRSEALEGWLDLLPEEEVAANAWYHYWKGTCHVRTSPRQARIRYEQAFTLFREAIPANRDALLLACSGAMQAIIFELGDFEPLDRWIEATLVLLDDAAPRSPDVEARALVSLCLALTLRRPSHPALPELSGRASRGLRAIDDPGALVTAQCLLAIALNCRGEFARVRDIVHGMRSTCRSPAVSPLGVQALHFVESMHCMFTANREGCLDALTQGLETGRANGAQHWAYPLLANGAAGALGVGDVESARALLAQMRDHLDHARPLELAMHHYCSAWLDMLCDNPVAALQKQKTALRLAVEGGCVFFEKLCRVALAIVSSELGDGERAFAHLSRARMHEHPAGNPWLEFHELMAFACVSSRHGRCRQGRSMLRQAFEIGRDHGYTHFLWWLPSRVSRLCAWALEEGIEVEYVNCLVRKRGLSPESGARYSRRWPWRFRIHTFGAFELLRDDRIVASMTKLQRKPIELLKALIAFGGVDVPESRLAGSLWPRIDADYAYGSLNTTLHRLRRLIGEGRLISLRSGHLSIDSEVCWMDLHAFEAVTDAIGGRCPLDLPSEQEGRIESWSMELFRLYRGPFMSSEGRHSRYLLPRGRFRMRFLHAVGELARYWEERGEWERAADCYERGIKVEHLAERFYRRLMLCYQELGRIAQAIDIYAHLRANLEVERSALPAPETTLIYHRLVERL